MGYQEGIFPISSAFVGIRLYHGISISTRDINTLLLCLNMIVSETEASIAMECEYMKLDNW